VTVARPSVVGIDLGTTHSCLAFAPSLAEVLVLDVPQLVPTGREARPLLPSALYAPAVGESLVEPWTAPPWITGELARARGLEVPGRSVQSAKSWLGHPSVDASDDVLPWGGEGDAPRVSPVDASARYLAHLGRAFDEAGLGARLAECDVVLTVPASFHDGARALTLEAARRAGLAPRLLEEPQAAFYEYMHDAREGGLAELVASAAEGRAGARVLVVDVGGGTTDLSLLDVTIDGGRPSVERVATGDHLLLGGDNMDLALARLVEPRLSKEPLPAAELGQLVLACRAAKEALLGPDAPSEVRVSLAARGGKLVGGTRAATLTRDEVKAAVLDGFFPDVPLDATPAGGRSGLVTTGLPYARDPAITRHVAAFLRRYGDGRAPDAVLVNGGVFRSPLARARLAEVASRWAERDVVMLPAPDPDLAVARGAVRYGFARRGEGLRIQAGAARGYYLGAADEAGAGKLVGVCLVPRGTREGDPKTAPREMKLTTGKAVRLEIYVAESSVVHAVGDTVDLTPGDYTRLPPLVLKAGGEGEATVRVTGELSPVGTLDLACVEVGGGRRFALSFQVRRPDGRASLPPPSLRSGKLAAAVAATSAAFEAKEPRLAKDLFRDLEKILGDKAGWTTDEARSLYDACFGRRGSRRWSQDHERAFWMLAGFTLRPGFGAPGDAERVGALAPLFTQKLAFPDRAPGWQAFFIAWRRIAGGLGEPESAAIFQELAPYVAPAEAKLKKSKSLPLAPDELRELLSWLERLSVGDRQRLGGWLMEETWTSKQPRLYADIARVGARVPAFASGHHVVPPAMVEAWLDQWMRGKWDAWMAAPVVRLARLTGDRARDVSERVRRAAAKKLREAGAAVEDLRPLEEVVEISRAERAQSFGDTLPLGLTLQ
jgi:molecular chaperone DnaK (HSP70)